MSISNGMLKAAGLGAMLIGGIALASPASAQDKYLFQWDDATEGHLFGDTYQNGVLIQHSDVGPEDYDGLYGLWAGTIASDFDVAFNIYDADGLSDTWHIFGTAGDGFFGTPFHSDTDGGSPLTPLSGAVSIWETGAYQTVYDFTVSNGDHYTLQFRSDAVPETASWALMLGGFGLVGAALRRRRTVVAFG